MTNSWMPDMHIDEPNDFFRLLHPAARTSGRVILERKFSRSTPRRSQIMPGDLEWVARQAHCVPEIFFSIASFSGQPLLLNFEKTTALHIQIPEPDPLTYVRASAILVNKGIPLPTAVLSDGAELTLLWVLTKPLQSWEFYKYALLEQAIFDAIAPFYPREESKEITFLTRMVGTYNSKTSRTVAVSRLSGEQHNIFLLEERLLTGLPSNQFSANQRYAGTAMELMALMSDRFFALSQKAELFPDWIIFIGAAICHFCSAPQLTKNLQAVAESLEGLPWTSIAERYQPLVASMCATAKDGFIELDGKHYSINHPQWPELIRGKLEITDQEIGELKLYVLGGIDNMSPHIHKTTKSLYPVGTGEFEPIQKLLLRTAA